MPSRGSLIRLSMVVATISWMRAARRRARPGSAIVPLLLRVARGQSVSPINRRRTDNSCTSGWSATNRSHWSSTSRMCSASAATSAIPSWLRRCRSASPTSAAATSNRRSCASIGRITDRLAFNECTSPSSTSATSVPVNNRPLTPLCAETSLTGYAGQGRLTCRCVRLRAWLLAKLERLDDVLGLDVVVGPQADTALVAFPDLGRVVLEPLERLNRQVVRHDHAVADQPGLAVPADLATAHDRTGDVADPRHPEDLPDLGGTELHLFELGLEHALERSLDLIDRLVDDRVVPDLDALAGR